MGLEWAEMGSVLSLEILSHFEGKQSLADFKGCQKLLIKMNYDEGFAAAFGRVSLGFFLVTRLHYMKVAGIFNLGGVWQQSFMG